MKRIISIGDIHGRDVWKQIIFGSTLTFDEWKDSRINNDSNIEFEAFDEFDKFIFIGDYVDSFNIKGPEIIENLNDIIFFARSFPDRVVLLLGNHDIQYIVPNQYCSGRMPEIEMDLKGIFNKNRDLFKVAHLEKSIEIIAGKEITKKYLWTHAGVTEGWYTELLSLINSDGFRLKQFFNSDMEIDEVLNLSYEMQIPNLFFVDSSSGGYQQWAGPLWVRPRVLNQEFIDGYNQIVGHTVQPEITEYRPYVGVESNPAKLISLTYIDCLDKGKFHELSITQ